MSDGTHIFKELCKDLDRQRSDRSPSVAEDKEIMRLLTVLLGKYDRKTILDFVKRNL